jgi:hypothetical protein
VTEPPTPRTVPVWLWPNILSVDAPVLALLWQDLVARAYAVPVYWPARAMLFLTTWAIYIGDRLLDARSPAPDPASGRHLFYRRYSPIGWTLLTVAVVSDAIICLCFLRPPVLHAGLVLSAGVAVYLGIVHLTPLPASWFPKEEAAALIFAAGTFLAPWAFHPTPWSTLLAPLLAFTGLCLANLVAIEMWEWRELRQGGAPTPYAPTRLLDRAALLWVPALALASVMLSPADFFRPVALSGAALTALFASGRRIRLDLRRVLADATLLTPLFFFRL